MSNYILLNKIIHILKYSISGISISIIITSILMLLLCHDVDFNNNTSNVCGIKISAIMFVVYIITILIILSIILCIIQCYLSSINTNEITKLINNYDMYVRSDRSDKSNKYDISNKLFKSDTI
jgi:hypothetical protein